MSLETEFANLTAAVTRVANAVELLLAAGGAQVPEQPSVLESTAVDTSAPESTAVAPKPKPAKKAAPTNGAGTEAAPTLDDCKVAAKAMAGAFDQALGRANTIAVLSRFGATKMPEVEPAQYADFIAACQAVQAGGEP